MTVKLTEVLNKRTGETENYQWIIEVWRSDARALANLRVKKKIIRKKSGFLGCSGRCVYEETDVSSRAKLQSKVDGAIGDVEQLTASYEKDQKVANEVLEE